MTLLISLIIFQLTVLSITNIIVLESVFSWLHKILNKRPNSFITKMLSCTTCTGFHVGYCFYWLFPIQFDYIILTMIVAAAIGSITNKLYVEIFDKI